VSSGFSGNLGAGGNVSSPSGSYHLSMQGDGNLVLYDSNGTPHWASNTVGTGLGIGQYANMQDDGNLVVYGANGALWASNSAGNGPSVLVVTDDGHIEVLRSSDGQVTFSAP
jgi:hypothetical protein